ncbi:MAG: hypothetical protein HY364_02770 [Candidatus Aenigmarchaeota archaeon]|nr:hypothetical protein [Candidatus Aenigmarchaeota archaeon]
MVKGYAKVKSIDIDQFVALVKGYKEDQFNPTNHSLFRLNEKQKPDFKETIKGFLFNSIPIKVTYQANSNYAAFYDYKGQLALKVVLSFKAARIDMITMKVLDKKQLPR